MNYKVLTTVGLGTAIACAKLPGGDVGDLVANEAHAESVAEADSVHTKDTSAPDNPAVPPLQKSLVRPAPSQADGTAVEPIRTMLLPNNVCVINTDLAPTRTIEEHIFACIVAQKRNQLSRRP